MKKIILILGVIALTSCSPVEEIDNSVCLKQIEEHEKQIKVAGSAFESGIISREAYQRAIEGHLLAIDRIGKNCK